MIQTQMRESAFEICFEDGTDPVAVFLLGQDQEAGLFAAFERLRGHRYCQALMKARHGESVLLEAKSWSSCPAAAYGLCPPAATAIGEWEGLGGAPGSLLEPLLGALESLSAKAIPRSRAKLAHHCLEGEQSGTTLSET